MHVITCFWAPADPGQAALIAAQLTSTRYAIKISPRDRLTGAGTDSIDYYRGLVMSARRGALTSGEPQRVVYNIGIDSAILTTPAT
jgi:hypothetical protein